MPSLDDFNPAFFSHEQRGNNGDVTVVLVHEPRLTEEQNLEVFGNELFALVENFECRKLVVNCSQVQYAASSALGKLITLHRKMHREGGLLYLTELQEPLAEILRASRLYDYFSVAASITDAVEKLDGDDNGDGSS